MTIVSTDCQGRWTAASARWFVQHLMIDFDAHGVTPALTWLLEDCGTALVIRGNWEARS